jgi:antitoxin component of MazEF toxin-antitoxin module
MELIYKAKPISRGRGSLAVKLPMLICDIMGITIDTDVYCYKHNGTLVFRFDDKEPEQVEGVF